MSRYTDHTDKDLLPLLNTGDEAAFRELYNRYSRPVYQYITSILDDRKPGNDIVQDIFIDLWERRADLHLAPTATSYLPYLFRAAKNKVIDYIRKKALHKKYAAEFTAMMLEYSNDSEEAIALNELRAMIEKSIAQLPERSQMAFRMSRYEGLLIPEIAKRMNISPRTVENYLTKALKHLRGSVGEVMALALWLGIWK
jgi:RNA polymerase sigma-70 factor (ECF subfamily)